MKIFAITNQKGGVGKTTTAVNLTAALADQGKRILLVDLDPQGNATTASGVEKNTIKYSTYQVILGQINVQRAIKTTAFGYDILPANRMLAGAEVELIELPNREEQLLSAISRLQYDLILIDCPPALNLLTINGLTAAQRVIIPVQCEYYALEGLSDLVTILRRVRNTLNRRLQIEGLVRTMFQQQSALNIQVAQDLESYFPNKVFKTIVPRNVRLAEAPSYGKPATVFEPMAKGSQAYFHLAEELMARMGWQPSKRDN